MLLCIANVLTADELAAIDAKLTAANFVDGKTTAGWHARLVKHNTQLASDATVAQEVKALIQQAIERNALFQMAARPNQIAPLLISRYEEGMTYGTHVDNAIMGDRGSRLRSDISLTLFLSDPTSYDGGELVIESTQGEQAFKLEAGAMILYPSSTLHRVDPVTRGVRLVAVTWIQSLIRDPGDREILFDLDTVRQSIFQREGKTPEFDRIAKSHANLLRKWMEL